MPRLVSQQLAQTCRRAQPKEIGRELPPCGELPQLSLEPSLHHSEGGKLQEHCGEEEEEQDEEKAK